jgi:hypothetical protein
MVLPHPKAGCELPCFECHYDAWPMKDFGTSVTLVQANSSQSRRMAATNRLRRFVAIWAVGAEKARDADKPARQGRKTKCTSAHAPYPRIGRTPEVSEGDLVRSDFPLLANAARRILSRRSSRRHPGIHGSDGFCRSTYDPQTSLSRHHARKSYAVYPPVELWLRDGSFTMTSLHGLIGKRC